jgi:4-deoxy-L-threo-5-hexosulose-uronate ketol-isomerase
MQIRHATSPDWIRAVTTEELRGRFLVEGLFAADEVRMAYSHEDRLVIGGALPVTWPVTLDPAGPVNRTSFLTGRELGILHVGGGPGIVIVDGARHELGPLDMLYVGLGERTVEFASASAQAPARFYFVSATAHRSCPDVFVRSADVVPVEIGSAEGSSRRRLNKVIHPDHVETSNLLMGFTQMVPGDTWNTMPPHLHDRRTEIYFYFDLPVGERVFHFMGEPGETRHLVVENEQAVISPSWSIHAGVGTCAYTFCWAMAGENCDYGDLDPLKITGLR